MRDSSLAQQQPPSTLRDGAIERMVGAVGTPLLEFVLNSTVDSIADGSAGAASMAVAKEIDDFLLTKHEGTSNPTAWAEVLKGQLTDTRLPGGPLALTLRARCGGTDARPTGSNEAERLLIE